MHNAEGVQEGGKGGVMKREGLRGNLYSVVFLSDGRPGEVQGIPILHTQGDVIQSCLTYRCDESILKVCLLINLSH